MFYETILGDTWDSIAQKIYGDEIHADWLMENNPLHIATMIFSAGTLLWIPDLPEEDEDGLPEWRD
ncbi:MAG: tail protein X [Eubacterium sp.]|nr:tail protein X [Eubacterium sp.]